jgi:hypothetical protein
MSGPKNKSLRWISVSIVVVLFIALLMFTSDQSKEPELTPLPEIIIVEIDRLHESVTIENTTDDDRDLSGWQLVSVNGDQRYTFPDGTILKSHNQLIIASGGGIGDLVWTEEEIWLDSESDRAELRDLDGEVVYDYDKNIVEKSDSSVEELSKDLKANSIAWHDYDLLVYHIRDALCSYRPSNGTTKVLVHEELDDSAWNTATGISRYCGESPDRTKYLLSTEMSYILQIHDNNTDELIKSFDFEDEEIYEAGWLDNEHIYVTTWFSLVLVNIENGEQMQVSEDSTEAKTQSKAITDYLRWAEDAHKIDNKLYYSGVRSLTNQINGNIYCCDLSGEQTLIEDARILLSVDNQRFVFFKEININSQVNDEWYKGIYLYDLSMKESTLITKDYKKSRELFLTDDSKIAFISDKTNTEPYYGVIFDPETLQIKRYEIPINEFSDKESNAGNPYIHECLGAYRDGEAYAFLFGARIHDDAEYKSYAFNSTTDSIIEVEGSRFLISPSGEYIAAKTYINEFVTFSNHRYKEQQIYSDVILSEDLMS